jgi:Flp pilus assembly protein TadG
MTLHRSKSGSSSRARRSWRRGGTLIEAALVLPIVMGLTFGMVEAGYYFFVKHTLQSAARDGVRTGIVPSGTNAKITNSVANAMEAAGLDNIAYQVQIRDASNDQTLNVATAPAQTPVKVVVSCNWSAISSGLRPLGVISATKQVTGAAVMLKE